MANLNPRNLFVTHCTVLQQTYDEYVQVLSGKHLRSDTRFSDPDFFECNSSLAEIAGLATRVVAGTKLRKVVKR